MPPNVPAWPVLGALVIGLLVRLLKSAAVPAPFDRIPPKARPLVALVLGCAQAAIESITAGTPWKTALTNGIVAAFSAVFAHDVLIEWLRAGKEPLSNALPVPEGDPALSALRDHLAVEAASVTAVTDADIASIEALRPTPRETPIQPRSKTEIMLALAEERARERAIEASDAQPVALENVHTGDEGGVR